MSDPNPTQPGGRHEQSHAEKMAELLAIYDEHKSAGLIRAIDYADSLATALEQERAARQAAEQRLGNLIARIMGDGGHYQVEHGVEVAAAMADDTVVTYQAVIPGLLTKLQAAERVVDHIRSFSLCPICDGQDGRHATNCTIAAYDATNQGSRGDANPSK